MFGFGKKKQDKTELAVMSATFEDEREYEKEVKKWKKEGWKVKILVVTLEKEK